MWRGEVTIRRVAALVAHLPMGSQVWRVAGHDLAWTDGDYLLAVSADALMAGNWQRGGGQGAKPQPVPRPREVAEKNRRDQLAAMKAQAFAERMKQQQQEGGE